MVYGALFFACPPEFWEDLWKTKRLALKYPDGTVPVPASKMYNLCSLFAGAADVPCHSCWHRHFALQEMKIVGEQPCKCMFADMYRRLIYLLTRCKPEMLDKVKYLYVDTYRETDWVLNDRSVKLWNSVSVLSEELDDPTWNYDIKLARHKFLSSFASFLRAYCGSSTTTVLSSPQFQQLREMAEERGNFGIGTRVSRVFSTAGINLAATSNRTSFEQQFKWRPLHEFTALVETLNTSFIDRVSCLRF